MLENNTLVALLGEERVFDDPETLERFSKDQSFAPRRRPDYVVYPETVEEVQQIVQLANETNMPVIPLSSGLNLHGAAVPDHGGILVNLSRMNRIVMMDEKNLFVMIEPGVTYEQLQDYLVKRGYRVMIPFGVPPKRSVLTSYLERDPVMAAPSFEYGNYLIMDTEIVLPTGELFKTGIWSTGDKPGGPMGPVRTVLFRLWTGAQGTLGIMTKMGVHIHRLVKEHKVFFIPFERLSDAIEPLKCIQRQEIGLECFLINAFNLAALTNRDWEIPSSFPSHKQPSASFAAMKEALPPWTLVICLQGAPRHPAEKIAYEEEALRELCEGLTVHLRESIPQCPGLERTIADETLHPWGVLRKFNYRGSVHDLNFLSPLKKVPEMESTIMNVCSAKHYDCGFLGGYLLPIERGRGIHCEFDLHCDMSDNAEKERVRDIWLRASQSLVNRGAYFSRPYGPWAEMMYSRSGNYTKTLQDIKAEVDPKAIMNPGKLCF
jgi:FAD/FMN-containing dehydrogenase